MLSTQQQNKQRFEQYTKEQQKELRQRGYFNRGNSKVMFSSELLDEYEKELELTQTLDDDAELAKQIEQVHQDTLKELARIDSVHRQLVKSHHQQITKLNDIQSRLEKLGDYMSEIILEKSGVAVMSKYRH